MERRELKLAGLDCANCALTIEKEVNRLPGVRASVNAVTQEMTLDLEPRLDFAALLPRIAEIVRRVEPDVVVKPLALGGRTEADRTAGQEEAGEEGEEHDEHDEHEGHGRRRSAIVRLAAGGVLFAVGLLAGLEGWPRLAVFLASWIIVGGSVLLRAAKGIVRGQVFGEHFLMSVATIGAFAIGADAEGAAVMLFYLIGEMVEDAAVDRSRRSIGRLLEIRPDAADVVDGETIRRVAPEDVRVGETILVKAGARVPLDGTVRSGRSSLDLSALTGESAPVDVEPGSEVLSGAINLQGTLTLRVDRPYAESAVARILDLVRHAVARKAPTERFIAKFARVYTPAVVFLALALAVLPPLLVPGQAFSDWIHRALLFLVVSCPCALVISVPLGFFGGIGGAAKHGILVKGGNYLEALHRVDTVVFDKTGTLTHGSLEVSGIHTADGVAEDDLLEAAAYAESRSTHPLARAVRHAWHRPIDPNRLHGGEEFGGRGLRVSLDGEAVLAGSDRWLSEHGVAAAAADPDGTTIHIARAGRYLGWISFRDGIKDDAAAAIQELKRLGVRRTAMLTGDRPEVGQAIGERLGLDETHAGLLPDGKVERLERFAQDPLRRGALVFVGDGINDAPVLARADVGIAMGGLGSDAAIEAADVVIMTDEPSKVAAAVRIARRTRAIVLQNIAFALGVKVVFLALGALGVATMWEAVFGDMGVSVLAILNATRAMRAGGPAGA